MKLTTRGFTLVELMIVIAIIGILAAALFPSLTSYLKRSRDAARAAGLKDISTAIGAYYSDKEGYPYASTGCMSSTQLSASYMEAGVPRDPTAGRDNGCGAGGAYGYAAGTGSTGAPMFALTAKFENDNGGNLLDATGYINGFTISTTGSFSQTARAYLDAATNVKKGNGSGYVLYK